MNPLALGPGSACEGDAGVVRMSELLRPSGRGSSQETLIIGGDSFCSNSTKSIVGTLSKI